MICSKESRRQSEKKMISMHFFNGVWFGGAVGPHLVETSICYQCAPSIYLVLPVYDIQRSAAEDIIITHAAAAARNLTQPPHCDLSVPRAAPVAQASLLISPHRNVHSPGKNNVSCKSGRSNLILDVAKHQRIATHYSRLSSLDAAVPMQKVPQHLHPSIAQCQQQHRKSHFETSVTAHGQSEQDSALKRRCPHPSHKQA